MPDETADPDDDMPTEPTQLTADEMDDLAWDIVQGEVYIANEPDAIEDSFGAFLSAASSKWDEESWNSFVSHVGAIYEDMDSAMPRAVNGRPMFLSASFLHVDDLDQLLDRIEEYEQ